MKLVSMSTIFFVLNLPAYWQGHAYAQSHTYKISRNVADSSKLKMTEHKGESYFENYLSMEVPFEPVADLFKQVLVSTRQKMTNRGEAHITVVTPVEYNEVLKKFIDISEIHEIAQKMKIQKSKVFVNSLGRGQKILDSESKKIESTYFLIVTSKDLVALRQEIRNRFVARGGNKAAFKPAEDFYPHITVGFTSRDLHASDGILKDRKNSFYKEIQMIK